MYTGPFIPLFLLALSKIRFTSAVKLPFRVHHSTSGDHLRRRADISGQTTGNTTVPVANSHNAIYISNITLGGQSVAVSLDTGRHVTRPISSALRLYLPSNSSDLWVAANIPGAQDTGQAASLSYAVGQVQGNANFPYLYMALNVSVYLGNIHLSTLTFDDYTVDSQAFGLHFHFLSYFHHV
jgi:hypothetical protein